LTSIIKTMKKLIFGLIFVVFFSYFPVINEVTARDLIKSEIQKPEPPPGPKKPPKPKAPRKPRKPRKPKPPQEPNRPPKPKPPPEPPWVK
jgi:hypothetical protein